jgi:hypothetical protein
VAEETAAQKNSKVGTPAEQRERAKRDFSTAQTDTFAGAKVEEKTSVCFGRNDKFAGRLTVVPTSALFYLLKDLDYGSVQGEYDSSCRLALKPLQ